MVVKKGKWRGRLWSVAGNNFSAYCWTCGTGTVEGYGCPEIGCSYDHPPLWIIRMRGWISVRRFRRWLTPWASPFIANNYWRGGWRGQFANWLQEWGEKAYGTKKR